MVFDSKFEIDSVPMVADTAHWARRQHQILSQFFIAYYLQNVVSDKKLMKI